MIKKYLVLFLTILFLQPINAKKIVIKMATLAPEGTEWHGLLVDLGQQWKEQTAVSYTHLTLPTTPYV